MSGFIYSRLLSESVKDRAKTANLDFSSIKEKYDFLNELSKKGILVGSPANELFTYKGDKHVIWIDVDSKRHDIFKEWANSHEFPFPKKSWRACYSATKNIHVYVRSNRDLKIGEAFSLKEWIVEKAPTELKVSIDRVYGTNNLEPVFAPRLSNGGIILPQKLIENCSKQFIIPDCIEGSIFTEWKKRSSKA